jgi:hypothetical protein
MAKKRMPVSFSDSIGGYIVSAILIILASTAATMVNAAETREIELTDGSVITGEVVSLSGGIYTVKSATLGTLRIEASSIRVIRLRGAAAPSYSGGQVKSLEDKMLGDNEIMDLIHALQNDPDLQKVLQDPEVMKAVQTFDIDALMRNPEFMKLLNKQSVQDINKKLTR